MNLKTKNEIIKLNLTKGELALIVEHMYWNLVNETKDFTECIRHYDKDIKFYRYLKNLLK